MPEMAEKERTVYRVFQRIAGRYDRSNVLLSLGLQGCWKRMMTGRVIKGMPEGAAVLDVCCGTGDIALGLARARKDFNVTGIDFSPAMLREAEKRRRRIKNRGRHSGNVRFLQANAMSLPFRDACFDAAVISFGLRNTEDYEITLRQMKRVVKEGGRIYCLDSLVPGEKLVRPFYRFYFRYLMPVLGGGLKYRKEYQWLYVSTQQFLRRDELAALFGKIGLEDIRSESRMFGACVLMSGRRGGAVRRDTLSE